jgi:hypothetical protein
LERPPFTARKKAERNADWEAKMQELEITWERVVRVWWLLVWRGLVGGWLIAIVLAYILGFAGAALGLDLPTTSAFVTGVSALAGLAWGLVVTRMALKKSYQEFHLTLVKKS